MRYSYTNDLPSIYDVRDAWDRRERDGLGGVTIGGVALDRATRWLARHVAPGVVRQAVEAFDLEPLEAGVLLLGVIGGVYVLAPAAAWPLLTEAAKVLAASAGAAFGAYVGERIVARYCPDCWHPKCERLAQSPAPSAPAPRNLILEVAAIGESLNPYDGTGNPPPWAYDGTGTPPRGYSRGY